MTNVEKDAHLVAHAFLSGTEATFAAITEDYARRVLARTREILDELKTLDRNEGSANDW